ncbi:hypothetical protein BY458DRAFT_428291 [Sporodiniella umbellata]|nr:hypothetical protein BY458DRAFT_428291 [Sporodiniella umbellata]
MNETELLDKRDRGTWYTGQGLKNAACYGRNGRKPLSPSVNDMIGAMAMNDLEKCYKCMEITNIQNKVQVVVKIVDKCAACKINRAVDLTPKAFSLLSKGSLDIGVLNISFKPVSCRGRISSLLKNL